MIKFGNQELSEVELVVLSRELSKRYQFLRQYPMPEDKPEEMEALLSVCNKVHKLMQSVT